MPRQTDFRVITVSQDRRMSTMSLEERLNDLADKGFVIMSVNVTRNEWVGNDSNHGHGGDRKMEAVIVCHRWENEHVG